MNYKELADLIFPDAKEIKYYEEKYPPRQLPEGAQVVRYAPSPTGFVHIGGLYQSLIAKKLAKQTGGVFFVRIEDTDQKREIENGAEQILQALKDYDVYPDETINLDGTDNGNYGPYMQSKRKDIYQSYAKKLLEEGNAYPCFCSAEDLDKIRENQEKAKERTGYYGRWTKCRNMPVDMAIEKIKNIVEESIKDRENRRFIFQNDKEKLGYITLYNIEEVHGKAEFAIMIDPAQQGKGYAKVATKLAIDYAFRVLNLRKLYLIVDATNTIARKVYEKMGFEEEAVLKEEYFVEGEYHDAVHMSIFQRDYFKK